MDQNQTVVLRVQLDEGKTQEQLQKLVLDIEKTKAAQAALTAERRAGIKSDEEFSAETVKLQQQLANQRQEYTGLNKTLDLYQKSMQDNYLGTQSALSLAQIQFQKTTGSQDLSTESAKALSGVIADLRGQLVQTDAANLLFVRSVGQYPKGESLEPLIKQLVLLQEVEKQLPAGSQQAQQAAAQIGFQYAKLNESAASAGLTQKDLTAKLHDYGERVRPATAELAKLEVAQDAVAKSAGKESEEFAKIGFQIGAARKQVAEVPKELAKVPGAAETAKGALSEAATKGLGLFGDQTDRVTGLMGKFKSGSDLLKQGLATIKGGGETGAIGLRVFGSALLSIGLGVFLLAIGAVVTYFTQSAEGAKLLAQGLAALGAVVQVTLDLVVDFGKGIVYAVTHPIEAIKNLGSTLLHAVTHPIDTARSLGDAVARIGTKAVAAAKDAASLVAEQKALAKERRQLEIDEVKEQSRINVLLRLSKERGKSATEQLAALKEAGVLEAELTQKSIALQQKELDAINRQIKLKGTAKAADLIIDKANKEKEIAQSLAAQAEVNAKIQVRESVFIQAQRAAAAAAAKQRAKDAVADKQTENELALLEVVKGSAAELTLKQQAIDLAADIELAGEKKTTEQVRLIRAKAEGDKLDLARTFQEKAIEDAKKHTAATVAEANREYAEAETNLANHLAKMRAALEQDLAAKKIGQQTYQQQLNALDKAGLDAALVNADDYGKDKSKIVKQQSDLEVKEAERVASEKKRIEDIKQNIQDAAFQAAAQTTDLIIELFGRESAAGQASLILKKSLALAEIGINLQKQLVLNAITGAKISESGAPFTIPLGVAYTIATDALAITSSATAAAKILGFRQGGVAYGPSHEDGGIQMYHRSGAHMGEFEGGEVILTKGVWDNKLLRPLASQLNVLGGGVPLMPRPHMALGAVAQPLILDRLRAQTEAGIDYRRLAQELAKVKIYTKTQETIQSIDKVNYTRNELGSS